MKFAVLLLSCCSLALALPPNCNEEWKQNGVVYKAFCLTGVENYKSITIEFSRAWDVTTVWQVWVGGGVELPATQWKRLASTVNPYVEGPGSARATTQKRPSSVPGLLVINPKARSRMDKLLRRNKVVEQSQGFVVVGTPHNPFAKRN
jgi:hypothetical protein